MDYSEQLINDFNVEFKKFKKNKDLGFDKEATIEALSSTYNMPIDQVENLINEAAANKIKILKKRRNALFIGLVPIVVLLLISFIMNISYSNKQVTIYNKLTAQQEVCEVFYDKMFKILKQKAGVVSKAKDDFNDIYLSIIDGRYADDDGSGFIDWIQKSNPDFDLELYKDLMVTIEHERTMFFEEQKVLIDINMTYSNLLQTIPSKWFVDKDKIFDMIVIKSQQTNSVYETGEENDLNLLN